MKISASPFATEVRRSLFQKLRLARPSLERGARLTLSFARGDGAYLGRLDRRTLERWAGPALKCLVDELERAANSSGELAEITLTRPAADPEAAARLRLRAQVFGELVRFSLAEQRLKEASERGQVEA